MSSSKPGSINKTLLTPCRQVGLSRKRKTPSSVKNPSVIKSETSSETPLKQPLGKTAFGTNSPHTPNIESQVVNIISEKDNKKLEKGTNQSEHKPTSVGRKSKKTPVLKDKLRKRVSRNLLLDDNTPEVNKEFKTESQLQECTADESKTIANERNDNIAEKKPTDSTPDKLKNNTKSDSKKSDKFKRILSVKSTFSSEEVFVENGSTDQTSLEENAVIALVELSNRDVAKQPTHLSRKILDDDDEDEDFVPSQKENKTRRAHKKLEKVKKVESKSKCKRIMSTDSEDDAKSVNSVTNTDEKVNIMEAENLSVGTSTLVTETVDQLHICTPTPDVSVTEDKVENESTPVTKVDRGRKSKKLRRCLSIKKTNSFDDSMELDECPKKEVVALEKECPIVEEFSNFDVDKIASKTVPETIPEHVNEDDAFTSTPEEDKFGRQELISQIVELETRIKKKRNYLIHLKQAQTFEKKNNLDEVKNLFTVWKKGCIQVLNDLLPKLETHGTMDMATLLKNLQIPPDIISISPKGELI